jgi:hypothetical protein
MDFITYILIDSVINDQWLYFNAYVLLIIIINSS